MHPHHPATSFATDSSHGGRSFKCHTRACSGYWGTIDQPAPEGTLICTFPKCWLASERTPASTDEIDEGDYLHENP